MRKQDKKNRYYYRSADRIFESAGAWYYETRDADHGPFATREAAQEDLARFLQEAASIAVGAASAPGRQVDPKP